MIQSYRLNSDLSFFQKVKELDYILLISILILSFVSLAVMYSTDGGEILYHTKSHFSKLAIFFPLMIIIAFFNIKYWHTFSLGIFFWSKSLRVAEMDGFVSICVTALGINENFNYFMSCKILSQNKN